MCLKCITGQKVKGDHLWNGVGVGVVSPDPGVVEAIDGFAFVGLSGNWTCFKGIAITILNETLQGQAWNKTNYQQQHNDINVHLFHLHRY